MLVYTGEGAGSRSVASAVESLRSSFMPGVEVIPQGCHPQITCTLPAHGLAHIWSRNTPGMDCMNDVKHAPVPASHLMCRCSQLVQRR